MSIRGRNAILLLALMTAVPARAQSIFDTVHQLRSTIGQLGGKRRPPAGATTDPTTSAQVTPGGAASGGGGMVPSSVLVDDASDSALERAPLVQRRVATFDVRGLKLGMSPREVGRIADREGFKRRLNDTLLTSGSFEVEAARMANQRLNRQVAKTSSLQLKVVQGVDAAGDRLGLEFTLEPSGPKLSRIEYNTRLDGSTRAQTIAALVRKYGPLAPPRAAPESISWSNATKALDNSSPELIAVIDDDSMALSLTQSVDYGQAARKRLEDRAQQIAATRGGGVKF